MAAGGKGRPAAMPGRLRLGPGRPAPGADALVELAEARSEWYRKRYVFPARRAAADGTGAAQEQLGGRHGAE